MQPKEGALAWICSFAMAAKPKNEDLAYAYLNIAYSSPAMDYLVNAFFTGGSAMTPAILAKTDPKFVKQFHLDSLSTALKPPKVWLEHHLENRNAYLRAVPAGQVGLIDDTRGGRRVRPPRGSRRGSARLRTCSTRPRRVPGAVARRYSTWLAAAARPGGADRVLPRAALLRLPVLDRAALPGRDQGGRADQRRAHELLVGSLARAARHRRRACGCSALTLTMPLWLLGVLARCTARGRAARQSPAALRRKPSSRAAWCC